MNTTKPRVRHLSRLELCPMFGERYLELPFREWKIFTAGIMRRVPCHRKTPQAPERVKADMCFIT